MTDIRFYDFEFNLLHIEHNIISANWTIKYNAIGSFEAHFPINGALTEIALSNPYLVAIQGDYQAIVTGKQATQTELILYGKTINWILSKRITPKFNTYDMTIGTNAETIVRWVVSEAFSDVENFVLADALGITYEKEFWRNTANPASEVVSDCLDNAGAGHRVIFDRTNKRWVFEVIAGKSLSLLVSKGNLNAYSMTYTEDLQDYANEGWYEKESEDGADPVWTHIAGDDSKTGIYRWEAVLAGTTKSEALSSLKTKNWEKKTVLRARSLVFGADYGLGDIVRVQSEFGGFKTTKQKRIIGVNAWFENNNIGEEPIFEEG